MEKIKINETEFFATLLTEEELKCICGGNDLRSSGSSTIAELPEELACRGKLAGASCTIENNTIEGVCVEEFYKGSIRKYCKKLSFNG